jgi:hypothetical protein
MAAGLVRLMPGYDPLWEEKLVAAETRRRALVDRDGPLSPEEQRELLDCDAAVDVAVNARFRTTAEYRDYYYGQARIMLDRHGLDMLLPRLPDDATVQEVDHVMEMVLSAIEYTNSETF